MKHLLRVFLIILALLSAAGIYFWQTKGLHYYSVQSDSMVPSLRVGDLVVDEKIQQLNIKPGDIVSYVSPDDPRVIISHRTIKNEATKAIITTRGDNLTAADPPVTYGRVMGKTIKTVPYAGYLLDTLRNPIGLITLIYIPVLAIALIEIRKLFRQNPYKHPRLS